MSNIGCGLVSPKSTASSVKSRSSKSSSHSSSQSQHTIDTLGMFDNRNLTNGDKSLAQGDYDNSIYYYDKFLKSMQYTYSKNDDRLILAYEKIADAEATFGKGLSALRYYRPAIDELRTKTEESVSDVAYEKDLNTRFSRILVNCGNVYLQLSQNPKEKRRRVSEYSENAILCYQEALPLVQELNGMDSKLSIHLVQRFTDARENLAKYYLEKEKINLALTHYQESIKTLTRYMNEFSKNANNDKNKSHRIIQYLYLKQTINVGNLCLRQNRLEAVLMEYGEALQMMGLSDDDEDEKNLENLHSSLTKLICTISHNMGVIHLKKETVEEVDLARSHFERAIKLNRKLSMCPGCSVLGLGEAFFVLKEFDKALQNLLEAEKLLNFEKSTTYKQSYADAFSKIASVYEIEEEFDKCFSYLDKEIKFLRWTLTGEDQKKQVSAVWHKKACIQFGLKKYKEALESHKEALHYRRKIIDPSFTSQTLKSIGEVHAESGDYQLAFESYDESLDYSTEAEKMPIYFELADVLFKMSSDFEAIKSYESCLALASTPENIVSSINIVAECLSKLGSILIKFEEYMLLKITCEDLLQKIQKSLCPNEVKSSILIYLGKAHLGLGDYDLAMSNSLDAKQTLKRDCVFDYMKNAVFFISDVHMKKNEIDQCLSCLKNIISVASGSVVCKHQRQIQVASIHDKIASVQVQDQRYDDALQSYRKVLVAKETAYSMETCATANPDADIALTLTNLGEVYAQKSMYNEALEQLRKASSVVDEKDTKASILCKIGEIEFLMGNGNDALDSFHSAYSMVQDDDPSFDPEIIPRVLYYLGKLSKVKTEKDFPSIAYLSYYIASGAFNATFFRFEEAMVNYEKALLHQNKTYVKDREELMRSLSKSKFNLSENSNALEFVYTNKNRLKIDKLCVTYDEHKFLVKEIVTHFARNDDFESCVRCFNYTINFAMMLIPGKIDLTIAIAKSLQEIGCVMKQAQNYDSAVRYHELSLCTKKILYSDANQDTSFSYSCISEIYDKKGEYQISLNNLKEAMNGSDEDNKVLLIDKMAIVLSQMQRFNDAKDCYQSALLLCENMLPGQRILLLNNLGNVYVCSGQLDEALSCYSEAIAIKSVNQKVDEDTEHVLFNIGLAYFQKNAFNQSFDSFNRFLSERASDTISQSNNLGLNGIASVLNYVGAMHLKQKSYREAIEWLQHSVELLRAMPQQSSDLLAGALSNLGCSFFHIGEYDSALLILTEAIQLSKIMTKKNEKVLASVLGKSAWINFRLRNYDLSLKEYQQVLDLKKTSDEAVVDIVTLHNIALVKCKKHMFDDATNLLNQVRDHTISTNGAYHPEVAKVHIDLGNISCKRKQFTEAEAHYAKALVILEKADCSQHHPYQVQHLRAVSKLWTKNSK